MPWVMEHLPADIQSQLDRPITSPCLNKDRQMYERLRAELALNPSLPFDPTFRSTSENCSISTTAREILLRGFVDDPDRGIDQNLPDSYDPMGERAWMGGTTGTTSQGFRHMYFGGWKLAHPIITFQIPLHATGEAPNRTQLLFDKARELFATGETAWGWRLVAWSLHYVQDLAQPFHSVQILTPRWVPWADLFMGPSVFVAQGTRIVANYHWAYEYLTLEELQTKEPILTECLTDPKSAANLVMNGNERLLALSQARASIELGAELGKALMGVFGEHLMDEEVDLVHGHGTPDYRALAQARTAEHEALDRVSCKALSNAILISDELITRATRTH